jgi:subtilisin-like proprotein convertase family protein
MISSDNRGPGEESCAGAAGAPTFSRSAARLLPFACLAAALALAPHARAQQLITNGGFETGSLTGWTTGGTAHVQALRATDVTPNITPPAGTYMAGLSTGPGNAGGAATQLDGNSTSEYDVATLSQTFTVTSAPVNLSFTWAFLTGEGSQPNTYDDLFDVTLNGSQLLRRSVYKQGVTGISAWPDTPAYDGVSYSVTGTGILNGSSYASGKTGFSNVCVTIPTPGTYTLQFRVADQGDSSVDSMLLVDNIQVPSSCVPPLLQVSTTSGSFLQVKSGGLVLTPVTSHDVALSNTGGVIAFVSNGNITGDNPNGQAQIFVNANGVYERLTSATSGNFSRPSLTSNGRWVAFASTADLTGGNADGNWEIFRYDRTNKALVQVTSTTGCSNTAPSIAVDASGNRIAFVSNCSAYSPTGNDRIVWWNGTTFTGSGVAGCRSYGPTINRLDGRYVGFVSACVFAGGSNSDGNFEIWRWDTTGGTFAQVTNSTGSVVNDVPSTSADGAYLAFLSTGDYVSGSNSDGNMEVFRWQSPSTFLQLTNTTGTIWHTYVDLSDDERYAAVERLDASVPRFDALIVDTTAPSPPTLVASASDSLMPSVGLQGTTPVITFQSASNYSGGNSDGNLEVWSNATTVNAPKQYCVSPNLAIPDNNTTGVTSTITVPDTGTVLDVTVYVKITHPRVGDLVLTLTNPSGTKVTLLTQPSCTRANIDATLDDTASSAVQSQCATTTPTISGMFTPYQPLAAFSGQALAGIWSFNASDRRSGNTGTLVQWCLNVHSN